jgi:putative chitinase
MAVMSDKHYTAERHEDGSIRIHMPGTGYIVEPGDAQKLRDSLNTAIPAIAIAADRLRQIMPNLPASKLSAYWPHLNAAMEKYEINTPLRAAAFLTQLAHESGELKWMEEIWGPTPAQKRYEGRADLGNTEPGDGYRFRGRGPIQLTGRDNYKKYGELLGIDLVGDPDLAAKPEYAFQTAALYWKLNGCNELADVEDFVKITRKINGGLNGLADRQRYYERAKKALGITA